MQEWDFYLGFALTNGIGPKRFASLLKNFKTAKNIWNATELELKTAGLGPISILKFIKFRKEFNCSSYLLKMKQSGVQFIAQIGRAHV